MNTPAPITMTAQVINWLMAQGHLKPAEVAQAQQLEADDKKTDLLELLTRLGRLSEQDLATAWSTLLEIPLLRGNDVPPMQGDLLEVSPRFLKHYGLVPLPPFHTQLHVLFCNPTNRYPVQALEYASQRTARLSIGMRSEIEHLIERYYGQGRSVMGTLIENLEDSSEKADDIEHLKDMASEAPVIRIVNLLLQRAVELNVSDIHIEPFENQLKVRYRIDGILQEGEAPPVSSSAAVISRIKIMARLDIAERRMPQDGRMMLRVHGKELDLRVSTVPTRHGESVVMRLLDRKTVTFDFPSLGFDGQRLQLMLDMLERPHGILLVTGPTGSGKTTTLYTALTRLNTAERKIITVEDPVEYQLAGVNQIQVKPAIGLDFAGALRSIVRQDPDVIMIGEIRDLETCRIAIQSSLTGHLVLSTLHTNSAAASITRLLDMGVESYLIASTVTGILAQRLVRRLDPQWREAFEASAELIAEHQLDRYTDERPIRLYRPSTDAPGTGYRGRSAITELLVMDEHIRLLLMRHADSATLEQAARSAGMRTLLEEGLRQALAGITSLEEILRVTRND